MKILDIITPHETLTEDILTRWFSRALGRSAGTTAEQKVSSWVDSAIRELEAQAPGHEIKRSRELKRAESALISVMEKNPYPQQEAKIDSIAQALADYLVEDAGRAIGDNAIGTLVNLVRLKSIKYPSAYGSEAEFLSDPFIVTELQGLATAAGTRIEMAGSKYIRKLAEAKTQVYNEIKNIQPVKTKKTKEEQAREKLEKDKLANDQKEQDNRSKELNKQEKEIKNPYPKGLIRKTIRFGNDVAKSLTRWDALFASAEFSRLVVQYWAQHKAIEIWANAQSGMPDDLAKLFPPVIDGKPQVGGEAGGKSYTYSTEEDRYGLAAAYAYDKIWARLILQIQALGVSLFLSQGLLYVGGGTAGKASTIRRILNIVSIYKTKLGVGDVLAPILRGSSKLGQMLFVDYFISVTNPNTNRENSYTAGIINALNKVPEYVNSSSRIPPVPNFGYDPNIYNAWKDFSILDIWYSDKPIKEFIDSGLFQHTSSALARGVIPIDAIVDVIAAGFNGVVNWILAVIPYLKDAVPADDLDIPVGTPKPITGQRRPQANVASDSQAGKEQGELANVPPPDAPASAPVQDRQAPAVVQKPTTNPELDPFTLKREPVRESLKRRVEKLMRS